MKWLRYLPVLGLVLIAPGEVEARGGATSHEATQGRSTCIGGARCGSGASVLEVTLRRAPVEAIRFHAHDDVGRHFRGKLRISIDGRTLVHRLDVRRSGRFHEISGRDLVGHRLEFRAASHDEVVISDVEVLYRGRVGSGSRRGHFGSRPTGRLPTRPDGTCFGGPRCPGQTYVVELSGAPVEAVRFWAHDDVGPSHRGVLRLRLDGRPVAWNLEVSRDGGSFEIDLRGRRGHRLVFESLRHEEVVIGGVEVLYDTRRRGYRR